MLFIGFGCVWQFLKEVVIPLWAVGFALEPAHGSVALDSGLGDKVR